MFLLRFLSRRWFLTTLLVVAGVALCIRLGIWQLDRLEQRKAFNARVTEQITQPPLELLPEAVQEDLYKMEYRKVVVRGTYDHSQEVALRNQVHDNLLGIHLLTPLKIEGTEEFILVDRGWIPFEDFSPQTWGKYAEPGVVEVSGIIRRPQTKAEIGSRNDIVPAAGEPGLKAWHLVNTESLSLQMPYELLPVYIQQAPDPAWTGMPYRSINEVEISEGPHFGYAIQWFTFATILGLGYPFFIQREEKRLTLERRNRQGGMESTYVQ